MVTIHSTFRFILDTFSQGDKPTKLRIITKNKFIGRIEAPFPKAHFEKETKRPDLDAVGIGRSKQNLTKKHNTEQHNIWWYWHLECYRKLTCLDFGVMDNVDWKFPHKDCLPEIQCRTIKQLVVLGKLMKNALLHYRIHSYSKSFFPCLFAPKTNLCRSAFENITVLGKQMDWKCYRKCSISVHLHIWVHFQRYCSIKIMKRLALWTQ